MYGQMTAGSWIYIGTQGILQGTYETFAECARQHFGGTLKEDWPSPPAVAEWVEQPLSVTMNEGTCLIADPVNAWRNGFTTGISTRSSISMQPSITGAGKDAGEAVSIGWLGNAVHMLERLIERDTPMHSPIDLRT